MPHTGVMAETPEKSIPRPAGRPATIDPDIVAATALALFAEHGYGQVSMAQIADAAGIGRKSLYRYFDSKADLVWGGLGEAAAVSEPVLDQALQTQDGLLDALHSASIAAMRSLPDLEVTRGRLRLIAEQPELTAQAPLRLARQQRRTEGFLLAAGVDILDAHYLAVAHGSLSFAAWVTWAKGDDPTPIAQLRRAMSALRAPARS